MTASGGLSPRVLIQRYDEMVADPVTAVVQLARHLGLGVARRQAIEIADEYSLESNLTRIEALRPSWWRRESTSPRPAISRSTIP